MTAAHESDHASKVQSDEPATVDRYVLWVTDARKKQATSGIAHRSYPRRLILEDLRHFSRKEPSGITSPHPKMPLTTLGCPPRRIDLAAIAVSHARR
jgi:hypothetical protein